MSSALATQVERMSATALNMNAIPSILVFNAGSSSIKFALYQQAEPLKLILRGSVERLGCNISPFIAKDASGNLLDQHELTATDRKSIINFLIRWFEQQDCFSSIKAVGHRVVHGMHYSEPEQVSQSLLAELHHISPYDPEHLPLEIDIIEALLWRHPMLKQVACFDTAFHRSMPRVAKLLPIPRRFTENGVQRYGFHGLSYAYLIQELESLGEVAAKRGRVILAHLGNGASMAAVLKGKSIDTSMCFTPASGIPMSTRSGDIDPGLISYLMQNKQMTSAQIRHMVNSESGLLGVSETSSDMRVLLENEAVDARAAEAVAMFCYQAKKCLGAYAAALGGIDALVFSGGIGEHAPLIRSRICEGLEFLGIKLNKPLNAKNASLISSVGSRVKIHVIHTNEELMIARSVSKMIPIPGDEAGSEQQNKIPLKTFWGRSQVTDRHQYLLLGSPPREINVLRD